MAGRPWSSEELEQMRLAVGTCTQAEFAARIDRTENAVMLKSQSLGYVWRQLWTEQDDEQLRVLAGTCNWKQAAEQIGREYEAVKSRASKLGLRGITLEGENAPWWRGGSRSHNNYSGYWTEVVRPSVLERDAYTCRECGLFNPSGRKLTAHHIVPWRFTHNNSLENHVTLCKSPCHMPQVSHWWRDFDLARLDELPIYQQVQLGVVIFPVVQQ